MKAALEKPHRMLLSVEPEFTEAILRDLSGLSTGGQGCGRVHDQNECLQRTLMCSGMQPQLARKLPGRILTSTSRGGKGA